MADTVCDEHEEEWEKTVKIRQMIMFVVQKILTVFCWKKFGMLNAEIGSQDR